VLEGEDGFIRSVMGGDFDVAKLTDFGGPYRILNTEYKAWAACGTIQGHLNATMNLVKEHDIKPEDIVAVRIQAGTRSIQHTGDPAKRYPKNKETADHSAYYVTAIAILERALGPAQYSEQKFSDPTVRELSDKISLEINTDLDKFGRAGITEISTRQGKKYSCRIEYPKGHPRNPMSDEELREKFHAVTEGSLGGMQRQRIVDAVADLEKINDISRFMRLLVAG